ncbi:glycoside hydrolase family 25 protein [Streptomyces sp. NBC_00986]|uniref:glycoside hydrolase family 25 protein n=1 Tax=Streptomyces sp. NBC_00986 TaxID=2903702 RepID=UPI00386820BA|nr:glycoside hydrolase family 25 protein [Streptomyces sp. NBC_00986]
MATCRGMDVSAYQGTQNWASLRRDGLVFAFAKASEGQHSRDAKFDTHIAGIIKAQLIPGAYHFAWPNQPVAAEAANYISAVKPYAKAGVGFTHWLDLERYSDGRNYAGRSAAQIKAWAAAWIAAVKAAFPGQAVGIYTSASDLTAGHVPAGVPLWYPAYPGTRVDTYAEAEATAQPRPSGRYPLIWQFTSDPAGAARVDQSIAYLSEAALRAWAGGDTTTQEDDMGLQDKILLGDWIPAAWPKDEGLADKQITVNTALGSGYAHARRAADNTTAILAQLGAQQATIAKLVDAIGSSGGLTVAEVQAAAEAGAKAALATLGDKLQED